MHTYRALSPYIGPGRGRRTEDTKGGAVCGSFVQESDPTGILFFSLCPYRGYGGSYEVHSGKDFSDDD